MTVKVKICGITSAAESLAIAELPRGARPDYIGLVFAEKSRRRVSLETAREISEIAHSVGILTAGVFVEQSAAEISEISAAVGLDAVQLHSERYCETYVDVSAEVWRVCKSGYRGEFSAADKIVIDGGGYGGDGLRVKPSQFEGCFDKALPVILAGGLDCCNVSEAVKTFMDSGFNIVGADVSSGVEFSGGGKDISLIEKFIHSVRNIK